MARFCRTPPSSPSHHALCAEQIYTLISYCVGFSCSTHFFHSSRFLLWRSCQYLIVLYLIFQFLNWMCLRLCLLGIDGIGPMVTLALYKTPHHLFLLSLSKHYLPQDWRTHLIVPVFKSVDKSSVCNYRPISLLGSVSKVLERLIYNKIFHFVSPINFSLAVWISS